MLVFYFRCHLHDNQQCSLSYTVLNDVLLHWSGWMYFLSHCYSKILLGSNWYRIPVNVGHLLVLGLKSSGPWTQYSTSHLVRWLLYLETLSDVDLIDSKDIIYFSPWSPITLQQRILFVVDRRRLSLLVSNYAAADFFHFKVNDGHILLV